MKAKKWKVITIVSLVLIVLEIVLLFALILPNKKINDVFKALEAGNSRKAENLIDDLSDSAEEKVESLMDDFATYQCNQYIDGKIKYEKLDKILSAIDEMDDFYRFSDKYYAQVAAKEIISLYEQGYTEYSLNHYSDTYYDLELQCNDAYYNLYDTDEVDEKVIKYLDDKYQKFLAGEMEYEVMEDYITVAKDYFGGEPLSYAYDIDSDLYMIESYEESYTVAKEYYDNQEYFETMEACDNVYISEDDTTGYYDKFEKLRQDAYDEGKTFYVKQATDYANSGDFASARDVIAQIKEVYGDEVDVSSVEALMKEPWMDAYAQYMANVNENLKADAATSIKIGNCDDTALINFDDYVPEKIYLHDFDANGTPEMLLTVDTYAWIVGFDGSKAVLTGFIHAATFCDAPYFITIPTLMPDGYSGYELIEFSNNTWNVVTYYYAADDGSRYEVDGAEVSYDECSAKHDEIGSYENQNIKVSYGGYIDDYESVIYDYQAE